MEAQSADSQRATTAIDDYVRREMRASQIPGLALAVVKDGKVVKLSGYGLASLELDVPVTSDTVFDIASTTKPFTATAIMMLAEDGKLSLDDKLTRFIPNAPPQWAGITVRHLLSHTAGLKSEFMPTREDGQWFTDYSTKEMFTAAAKLPLDSPPGERYDYSDQGYFLLGLIIENVSGQRYEGFLRERIFRPAGMNATRLLDQWAIIKNFAPGYALTRDGRMISSRRHTQVELSPSYGILSTARDMASWSAALAGGRLLSGASLKEMKKPTRLSKGGLSNYALGWQLDVVRGHRVMQHGGGTGTGVFSMPDDGLTVIVLTNLTVWSASNPYGIALGVAGHYLPSLRFSSIVPQPDPDPELTRGLRKMLTQIAARERQPELLLGSVSEARYRVVPKWIHDMQSFTFLACGAARGSELDRFGLAVAKACYYRQTGHDGTRYYRFYLTSENKVADFWSHRE